LVLLECADVQHIPPPQERPYGPAAFTEKLHAADECGFTSKEYADAKTRAKQGIQQARAFGVLSHALSLELQGENSRPTYLCD